MNFEILRASGPLGHIELITHLAGVRDIASEGGRPVRVIFGRDAARNTTRHVRWHLDSIGGRVFEAQRIGDFFQQPYNS
jgi:hypothetical protein